MQQLDDTRIMLRSRAVWLHQPPTYNKANGQRCFFLQRTQHRINYPERRPRTEVIRQPDGTLDDQMDRLWPKRAKGRSAAEAIWHG